MGAMQSSAPRGNNEAQSRMEPVPFWRGLLSGLGFEADGPKPRSGSFGRSYLSKSSHSRLAASKGQSAHPSRTETSVTASPTSSERSSLTPNSAAHDYTLRNRRDRAEAGAEADSEIRRATSSSNLQVLKDALCIAELPHDLLQQGQKYSPVPQGQHHGIFRRPAGEPDVDHLEAEAIDRRLRSRSPAVPCQRSKALYHLEEEDEISVAHAERMYDRATWRMYDRIMTARAMKRRAEEAAAAASHAERARSGDDRNAKSAAAMPQIQKIHQPSFRVPMPAVPAADDPWKDARGPVVCHEGLDDCSSNSYPNVFSLDLDQ